MFISDVCGWTVGCCAFMEAELGAEVLLQLLMYVLFVSAYFYHGTAEGSVKLFIIYSGRQKFSGW